MNSGTASERRAQRLQTARAQKHEQILAERQAAIAANNRKTEEVRRDNVAFVAAWKLEVGCAVCGPHAWPAAALQLHHRDPESKDPRFKRKDRWSRERLLVELSKCTVLCANHHAMHHNSASTDVGFDLRDLLEVA